MVRRVVETARAFLLIVGALAMGGYVGVLAWIFVVTHSPTDGWPPVQAFAAVGVLAVLALAVAVLFARPPGARKSER